MVLSLTQMIPSMINISKWQYLKEWSQFIEAPRRHALWILDFLTTKMKYMVSFQNFGRMWREDAYFLAGRDLLSPGDLFISCPTTTSGKKLPDRAISIDRRILWGGRRVNLLTPKCDYYRPDYVKIEDISREIIRLSRYYHGVDILINKRDAEIGF